ncbi:MAG: transcription-repair coupling factor [Clostridia bacterium]|nr:transcription-repair coupling factor [Clostridia bacterium]
MAEINNRFLYGFIREESEYKQLFASIKTGFLQKPLPILVTGLCDGASDALTVSVIGDVKRHRKEPVLVVCPEEKECVRLCELLNRAGLKSGFYNSRDYTFYNITASHEYEHERLKVLSELLAGEMDVVLVTPDAALGYTIPPAKLIERMIRLQVGEEQEISALLRRLSDAGYSRVELVDGAGQFAVRGGILDIYPPYVKYRASGAAAEEACAGGSFPVRIELFGDEIDRIGAFDVESQRVNTNLSFVEFTPAREVLATPENIETIRSAIAAHLKKSKDERAKEEMKEELATIDALIQSEGSADLNFSDKYITVIYPERNSLLDYFPDKTLLLIRGTAAVYERLKSSEWHNGKTVEELLESGTIVSKYTDYCKPSSSFDLFTARNVTIHVDSLAQGMSGKKLSGLFNFRTRHMVPYVENFHLLCEDLGHYRTNGYRIILIAENETAASNLSQMLTESDFPNQVIEKAITPNEIPKSSLSIFYGYTCKGYELAASKTVILSTVPELRSGGLSVSNKLKRRVKKKNSATQAILSYSDLEIGDYVVHENYGIGQYMGIENLAVGGVKRDYINIRFAGSDRLYLPTEKMDLLSKYIGAHSDDGLVKLSKFGGAEWGKTKSRAKAAVKEMAKELLALYAARAHKPGIAFPPDDDFQHDFEAAFEYDETDSQLEAIEDIKNDMMLPKPMDRLLCGDVGFGKTEVALRAAYKAVMGGKQVAILVPTTILALQHFQTATSRMRSFGVSVDMISRFRTAKQQQQSLRKLRRGETDIIIGTHRLVSKDVEFKDLGLVIIDEEQRFGVAQKEKLKQISENVDVLTLTATPIPRTLNMAMGGIRDISVLDEAPGDRLPVQTYVLEEDDLIITEAIRRELRRGGQVFYLHNLVESINEVAARISAEIPEAKVTVAHGKMEKERLEDIWNDMLMGEIDVLVCTSIIETGIDVPNANTLIVDNAQRLGLSQLHQLRGRVGRSSRRAYTYFTYPKNRVLSEIAQKRLEAIREYAEFGAGFKIAMRDLELRGAGDILGAQQHGHLDAIGYELYIKLLNEAVTEEKGEKIAEKKECTVTLDFNAYIPESYVAFPAQRMSIYKRVALIENQDDVNDIADEMTDRYGDLPQPVENLLSIALLRAEAICCGISIVKQEGGEVRMTLSEFDFEVWSEVEEAFPGRIRIVMSGGQYLSFRIKKDENTLRTLHKIFKKYMEIQSQKG